jgi:RNA polymerase sigma-70 factor (ECF subfamily)
MKESLTEERLMEIYRETIEPLYGYASRRCGGQRELAEDVTQETWLRAVREWRRKGVPRSPIAWLTTVARNLIVDQLRRAEPVSIETVSVAEVFTAEEETTVSDSVEVTSLVTSALQRIPKGEALLLESFHFEKRRVAELAAAYGVSERAIEGRLRRARERLRNQLVRMLVHETPDTKHQTRELA